MSTFISSLKDSKTVAKFQQVCGIVVVDDTIYDDSGEGCNGHSHSNVKKGILSMNMTSVVNKTTRSGDVRYVISSKILYYLFHFGANLGNEIFYFIFLPFWFWNIDECVVRRVSVFWCIFMYVGQSLKDVFQIPRPSSPPVVQLEKRYASEYGMPSTHAMAGAGIPFAVYFLTKELYIYPIELALIGAIVWCAVVSASRIYLGMHSVLDVLAGLGLIAVLMVICLPNLGVIDEFLLYHKFGPWASILAPIVLVILYPTPKGSDTTLRDTAAVLASGSGIFIGYWLSFQFGLTPRPSAVASLPPPYEILPPTWTWASLVVVRMVLGAGVGITWHVVFTTIIRSAMRRLTSKYRKNVSATKYIAVIEFSLRCIRYGVLTASMVLIPSTLFAALGIQQDTFCT